jgi:hypothetical protein
MTVHEETLLDTFSITDTVDDPLIILKSNLDKLRRLVVEKNSLPTDLQKMQRMMIYSFCITSLEVCLSDLYKTALKNKLFHDRQIGELERTVLTKLYKQVSFQNLSNAKKPFKDLLSVDFPTNCTELQALIQKRHDFIHGGGRNAEGLDIDTNVNEIEELIDKVENFCTDIGQQLN